MNRIGLHHVAVRLGFLPTRPTSADRIMDLRGLGQLLDRSASRHVPVGLDLLMSHPGAVDAVAADRVSSRRTTRGKHAH